MQASDLLLVFLAYAAGGIIKGATGAGAPLLAVPLMVMLRDVQFAVAVFVLPNIVPNLWQYLQCRDALKSHGFSRRFALSGGVGAAIGTLALAGWSLGLLSLIVALALLVYILFRLLKPAWVMPAAVSDRAVIPVGLFSGALQGASGLSAPVSLTFLSAVGMERRAFMATISLFFIALGVAQLPVQMVFGIMTWERFLYSILSLIPLFLFMPVGAWFGRRLSPRVFDRVILAVLFVLAVKLIADSL